MVRIYRTPREPKTDLRLLRTINPLYIKMQIGFCRHYYQRAMVIFAKARIYLIYACVFLYRYYIDNYLYSVCIVYRTEKNKTNSFDNVYCWFINCNIIITNSDKENPIKHHTKYTHIQLHLNDDTIAKIILL